MVRDLVGDMRDTVLMLTAFSIIVFFFNATATTEIYTLSLHDALPISARRRSRSTLRRRQTCSTDAALPRRSEEHTSELQSRQYLVCRLLLEKKKQQIILRQNNQNKYS